MILIKRCKQCHRLYIGTTKDNNQCKDCKEGKTSHKKRMKALRAANSTTIPPGTRKRH